MPHFTVIDATDAPHFDGQTYDPKADHQRLFAQLLRVKAVLADGEWHSLDAVAARARCPQQSASARMRDLRKTKFGAHIIEKRCIGRGLWLYRMVVNRDATVHVGRSA